MKLFVLKKKELLVLLLFFLLINTTYSQTNWERTYGIQDRWENCYNVITSYDNGFLLAINYLANNNPWDPQYCTWLLKTDINGFPLWSKYFYNPVYTFEFADLDIDANGNIILTGISCEVSSSGDSFIMLLNSCGEKVWCKRLNFNYGNYGWRVKTENSQDYILYTVRASNMGMGFVERNQLWKFDSVGNILFCAQIVPGYDYPYMDSPFFYDLTCTTDNGYLLSGFCYLQDTTVPQQWWRLQHLLVKTDSVGNEIWVRPDTLNLEYVGGLCAVTESNNNYYTAGYKKDLIPRYQPYFAKVNTNGEIVFENILHPDTLHSILVGLQKVGNSFVQSGQCFYSPSDPEFMGIFKTDTLGNLTNHRLNFTGFPMIGALTLSIDNKILASGYAPYDYVNFNDVDAWAMKVNENLEYDTLYSFPFVYDSLCPFPIPTDTIDCDCDLITGYGEPVKEEERYRLHIYPNPADEQVKVRLNDVTGANDLKRKKVIMYDLFGRKVLEKRFEKEAYLDVGEKPPGIYVLVVELEGVVIAREKLIVL